MSEQRTAIGVDVGGTRTAAALVGPDGAISARCERPTPADDPDAIVRTVVEAVEELLHGGVAAVGVSAAGMVSVDGVMRFAPNLAWRDLSVADLVADAVGVPVRAENDNTAAGWGEFRFGAGRGSRHLLFVGVGTGIGGGIVLEGRPYRGAHGFAAEIGHVVLLPDGPECGCGNRGCWEQLASGTAITRAGAASVRRHPYSALVTMSGSDPSAITGEMVTDAARAGDTVSRGILVEAGHWLGIGIAGLVNVLDPDVVVIGGGVADAGDLLLAPARDAYARTVEAASARSTRIVGAELGNDAGAIGAATLALEHTLHEHPGPEHVDAPA